MSVCTIFCVIFSLAVVGAIPIAMLWLGAARWNECPMEPWVPIFMVVTGALGVITIILSMCTYGLSQKEHHKAVKVLGIVIALCTLFSFAWNIAGSVWVFKKWNNWDSVKNTDQGCYKDMYLFAFAYLIIFWITCPCQVGGGFRMKRSSQSPA